MRAGYRFCGSLYGDRRAAEPGGTDPRSVVVGRLLAAGCALGMLAAVTAVPVRAQTIPERVALTVTGDPATPEFLTARIAAAVGAGLRSSLRPGAGVRIGTILPAPEPLASGFLTNFRVSVTIDSGTGASPISGVTTVDVQNAAVPAFTPAILVFADDPERITADGVLSRTTVAAAQPVRLYYYHENVREPRRFCVVLSANDSVLSHVQIIDAAAGPNVDVMSVGHAATRAFLTLEPQQEGVLVPIAGGRPVLARDDRVGAGDGVVGALDLRVLDGGPVTVSVLAIPTAAEPAAYLYGTQLPADGHSRHGTFDISGFGQRSIAYSAGGRDVSYTYGSRAPTLTNGDPADPGRDLGDYGVLQRVRFDLDNATEMPATLYLYEKPLGGDVRSSFVVNGSLTEVGCVRAAQRYLVASRVLEPHTTGAFDVLTMTDGGSNYPLEIGVTTTPPLPAAPPISAADGCFPKPGGPPAAPQPAGGPPGQ